MLLCNLIIICFRISPRGINEKVLGKKIMEHRDYSLRIFNIHIGKHRSQVKLLDRNNFSRSKKAISFSKIEIALTLLMSEKTHGCSIPAHTTLRASSLYR